MKTTAEIEHACNRMPLQLGYLTMLNHAKSLEAILHQHNKNMPPKTAVSDTKQFRKDLDGILQELKQASSPQFNPDAPDGKSYPPGYRSSRERSLAVTKIQEAIMWLGMDLKAINEESPSPETANPYPESYNPNSPVIEPTADGLKL